MTATVEAGIPLWRLNEELARRGLALSNLGDIDRQTIAGATSTGTHGTGVRYGSIAAAIVGHAPAGGCVLALCCDYRIMASGGFRIGLNETQVGLAAPEGVQQLLRRVVGRHRAERMLVAGELVDAERALALGLVDELVEIDNVANRARIWLEELLALPRQPMLQTRAMSRADIVAALQPEQIQLPRFIDGWFAPDTQAGLRALVAKLGK